MTTVIKILSLTAAVALTMAPLNVQDWLRAGIRDGFRPGVQFAHAARQSAARKIERHFLGDDERELQSQIADFEVQIAELRRQLRRERLARERMREQQLLALRRHDEARRPIDSPPLIVPQIVQANVLGDELAASWRAGRLLDRGRTNGIGEDSLVLDSSAALVDQGEDRGLAADLPVFAGSCVIGKLLHVGRWSSTWVSLTDKRFRGRARLARISDDGLVFAAEGILIGNGLDGCSLTKIRARDPVSVGDEIYSSETPVGFEAPLFYGTVIRAELGTGATHWDIDVRPAIDPRSAKSVSLVRPMMNPKRLAN